MAHVGVRRRLARYPRPGFMNAPPERKAGPAAREARRLFAQGAVSVDGQKADSDAIVSAGKALIGPEPRLYHSYDSGPGCPVRYPRPCLMNVPLLNSSNAVRSSACEFITIGPYHATGSRSGLPETRMKRTGRASVVTVTVSPPSR